MSPRLRLVPWFLPAALFAFWELAARLHFLPASAIAPPSTVVARLVELLVTGTLATHLMYSAGRLIAGVAIGGVFGLFTGLYLGSTPRASLYATPTMQFLAGIPVVVWMPFWIVIFGVGEAFKVGLTATATFFLVHVHAFAASRVVATRYLDLAKIYQKTSWERIRHLFLPAAVPQVTTGLRIAMAIGWIVIFFVEYAASTEGRGGLGWFVADARQVGRIEDEFAGLLLLGVTAFLLDFLAAVTQGRFVSWPDTVDANSLPADSR